MATKNSRKKESWWQTFPGVLTAIAGLITALAGLVVALKNPPADKMPPSMEQTVASAGGGVSTDGQKSARREGSPIIATEEKTGAPVLAAPTAPGQRAISLPSGAEAGFPSWTTTMKVISARLEPLNAEKRSLRLKVRVSNSGSAFSRIYYWRFRLVVDDLPQAPSAEPPYEQVEAQSVKEVEYVFEVPAATRKVVFRISRDEETREIPIDLTSAAP